MVCSKYIGLNKYSVELYLYMFITRTYLARAGGKVATAHTIV